MLLIFIVICCLIVLIIIICFCKNSCYKSKKDSDIISEITKELEENKVMF